MALFDRTPKADLRVVLELSAQPDGTAAGEIDGLRVTLGRDRKVRIPIPEPWPGAMVSVREPAPSPLLSPALLNRSRHPGWTGAALARSLANPEVREALDALPPNGVRVEVEDDQLTVSWQEEPDGPSARRVVRGLVTLARELPAARAEVIKLGVQSGFPLRPIRTPSRRADRERGLVVRAGTSRPVPVVSFGASGATGPDQGLPVTAAAVPVSAAPAGGTVDPLPRVDISANEELSRQIARYQKRLALWTYGGVLGGPLVGVGFAILAGVFYGARDLLLPVAIAVLIGIPVAVLLRVRTLRFTAVCPRCAVPRSTLPAELADHPECPHCCLYPTYMRVAPRDTLLP